MVVVFHFKHVHDALVRGELFKLGEQSVAAGGEIALYLLGVHLRHVGIAAVCQELRAFLKGGGVEHPPGAVVAEQLRLPRAEHGGQAEVCFSFS